MKQRTPKGKYGRIIRDFYFLHFSRINRTLSDHSNSAFCGVGLTVQTLLSRVRIPFKAWVYVRVFL